MTSGRREAAARALGAAGSCAIRVTTSRNASESPRRAASRNPMGPSSLSHRPARSAPKNSIERPRTSSKMAARSRRPLTSAAIRRRTASRLADGDGSGPSAAREARSIGARSRFDRRDRSLRPCTAMTTAIAAPRTRRHHGSRRPGDATQPYRWCARATMAQEYQSGSGWCPRRTCGRPRRFRRPGGLRAAGPPGPARST